MKKQQINKYLPFYSKQVDDQTNRTIVLVTGQWVSPGTLVSSTDKTYHHNIAEMLLKVALNTINPYKYSQRNISLFYYRVKICWKRVQS
jgi:hypothetical protein